MVAHTCNFHPKKEEGGRSLELSGQSALVVGKLHIPVRYHAPQIKVDINGKQHWLLHIGVHVHARLHIHVHKCSHRYRAHGAIVIYTTYIPENKCFFKNHKLHESSSRTLNCYCQRRKLSAAFFFHLNILYLKIHDDRDSL